MGGSEIGEIPGLQFGSKDKMAMKPSVVKPGEWH